MNRATIRHEIDFEGTEHSSEVFEVLKMCGVMDEDSGENLDALYDELTALGEPTELAVSGLEAEDEELKEFFVVFRQVLEDAESQNSMLTVSIE